MKLVRLCLLILFLLIGAAPQVRAQGCTMCTAQTNSGQDSQLTRYRGQGINTGILYLAAVPYLAASALGFMWWRNRRRMLAQKAAQPVRRG